ncbi:MAG: hypothetical protein ACQESX_05315 [Bacteroidota bacterium]
MKKSIIFLSVALIFNSCTILEQAAQMERLSKCQFELQNTSNLTVAGVNMEGKNSWDDFSYQDALNLTMALTKDEIPASIRVHLEARNPNSSVAGMNRLDWRLLIDNELMTSGVFEESVRIPPNGGTTEIPMDLNFDLRQLLSNENKNALMNLISNLTGESSKSSEVAMKLSPSIKVGERMIQYPGDITVRHRVGK